MNFGMGYNPLLNPNITPQQRVMQYEHQMQLQNQMQMPMQMQSQMPMQILNDGSAEFKIYKSSIKTENMRKFLKKKQKTFQN